MSTNWTMHEYICNNYGGEIHISTGMTKKDEIEKVIEFYEKRNKNKHVVLYHCISGYPVDFNNLYLLEIARLKNTYGDRVKSIGFSGHHKGDSRRYCCLYIGCNMDREALHLR